jgi:pyruvate,water dikinase
MTTEPRTADIPIVVPWVGRDETPPGFWTRNDHYAVPVTRLQVDLVMGLRDGLLAALEEFATFGPPPGQIVVDGYMYFGSGMPPVTPSPERVAAFEDRVRSRHEIDVLRRWREEHRPAAKAELERLTALDLSRLSDAELAEHTYAVADLASRIFAIHMTDFIAASLVHGYLGLFCGERLGLADAEVIALLAGASAASNEPTRRLEDLADEVLASPTLRDAIRAPDPWEDAAVRALLRPYLDAYGHRATDFHLDSRTLAEQPRLAVWLLQEAMQRLASAPRDATERATGAADAAALRERLPAAEDRATFDRLLSEARDAYGVRDDDFSFVQWGRGLLRYAILEAGRRLAARGLLVRPELVWHLSWAELNAALNGEPPPDLDQRATESHAEHARQRAAGMPPDTFGTPFPPAPLPALSAEAAAAIRARAWARAQSMAPTGAGADARAREVRGVAGSAGVYTGRARVVLSEEEFDRVEPGDVLVCSYSNPSWTFLFGIIGAVVADQGGLLSHAAITSREYGIPCVVGTKLATRTIPDGALVTVDGTNGVVRLEE